MTYDLIYDKSVLAEVLYWHGLTEIYGMNK